MRIEEGALSAGIDRGTASVLPPQWVDDVDAVHQELADVTRLLAVMQSMHASRVGSVFGKDLDEVEGKIDRLTRDVTDRFRAAERYLQRVGTATRRAGGEEAVVGANVQRSLAKKLQELSMQFRQMQRKYLADVQAQKSGKDAGGREAKFGLMDEDAAGGGGGEGGIGFTTQQLAVVDDLQEAVQSRDKEIVGIAKSIEELGAIFKELAVLVIDQGTVLDRIDYNMEAVVEHTKEGIQQLEKAEDSQKNSRPLKCIVVLMFLIVFLLIILVMKHRRRHYF
jgi:syntaxin 16